MELFRIGGPNPDTNYLFMGKTLSPVFLPDAGALHGTLFLIFALSLFKVTTSTEATTQWRLSLS